MRIPLYNTRSLKPIVDYQAQTLSGVSLSGQSPIEIGISNTLTDLPVGLYKDIAVHSEGSDLWQDDPQAALQLPRSGPALLQPAQKLATGISLTAVMCQGQMASQQPRVRQQGPIAMGALPSGVLVVLGVHGKLSLVRSETGVAQVGTAGSSGSESGSLILGPRGRKCAESTQNVSAE